MILFSDLTQDEVRYICGRVSFSVARLYFQKNSKAFAKIKPGFRAEKLSDAGVLSTLVKNSNNPFVSTFLEKCVREWILGIHEHCESLVNEGYSEGEALLKTFPDSVFCDNVELYFKLIERDYDDDYIRLFRDSLTLAQKTAEESAEETEPEPVISEKAEAAISELREALESAQQESRKLKDVLDNREEQLQAYCREVEDMTGRLEETNVNITELEAELEHYRHLDSFADESFEQNESTQFQYVSIGKISRDYEGKVWINRLADIVEGEVLQFFADDSKPHYFSNRDRLYWKNGPDEENAIAIWNWRADHRDTDSSKDFITCEYNRNAKFTEVVELPQCKTLADVVSILTEGVDINFISEKVLFVCTTSTGAREGLLCSPGNLDYIGGKAKLETSIFMLPHYSVKPSDTLKLGGIRIHKKMNLGIPQSVVRVRTPYDAVKRMILARANISLLREYDLSRREAQGCKRFLESIPTQTLVQELADAYACSEKEAQEYVDGFIAHADTYLSASDLDLEVLGKALERNKVLVKLCKDQLSDEWETENAKRIEEADSILEKTKKAAQEKESEIADLALREKSLHEEADRLGKEIAEKEKLAADVEEKISERIEEAKRNAADFISSMAFVTPAFIDSSVIESAKASSLTPFRSRAESDDYGKIDDIDTFEEELTENLTLVGYNEETAVEMSQALSYSICKQIPVVAGENADAIGQCLAATMGGGELIEFFITDQSIEFHSLINAIVNGTQNATRSVILLHGVFDGYSITLFNAVANWNRRWGKSCVILLSLEGIPVHMIPKGVWDQAVFIDGDEGLQEIPQEKLHAFQLETDLVRDIDETEFKEMRKQLRHYSSVLSNKQIRTYAEYLAAYGIELNDSQTILSQMFTTARSSGKEEQMNSIFHEFGITKGEKILEVFL